MGLRLIVNNAMAWSLSLIFLVLIGCACALIVGLVRLSREKDRRSAMRWIATSLTLAAVLLAATPIIRPGLDLLVRWAYALNPPAVSMEKYLAIRSGMTFDEVKQLLGGGEIEFNRVEQPGYSSMMYQWNNEDGSFALVTFNNGIVANKNQTGLE